MQKVIRRSVLASNQAKRKARINAAKEAHDTLRANLRDKFNLQRGLLDEAAEERKTRREDWIRGPLAPRRDIAGRVYGAVATNRLQAPKIQEEKRLKYINLAPGDRACVIKGRDKGSIGKVTNVDEETETVSIEGVNIYDVEFPKFALNGDTDKRPYRPYPLPIPLRDVRLVVPLEDPATGVVKDVIVQHCYGGEPILERPYGDNTPKHTRYISGLDVEIPWPESAPAEFKDESIDTLRIEVDAETFVPALQSLPMPATVIDELRNKYSTYRTRHDPEYIAKKQREDAIKEWRKTNRFLTPKTEYLVKKSEEQIQEREQLKDEQGNYKLSEETTDFIEKYMVSRTPTA